MFELADVLTSSEGVGDASGWAEINQDILACRQVDTSDGQHATLEGLARDFRVGVDVSVVAVETSAECSHSINSDEDLGSLCIRGQEVQRDRFK